MIAKLTVGQFREHFDLTSLVLKLSPHKTKSRCSITPIHQQVANAIRTLLASRSDDALLFEYNSLAMWVKRQKIPLTRINSHFVLGDLRKFTEQYGDIIQWDQSNRACIMTHGVSGVDWRFYKHSLPENVYDVYIRYWGASSLSTPINIRIEEVAKQKRGGAILPVPPTLDPEGLQCSVGVGLTGLP